MDKTPQQIAESWYHVDSIAYSLELQRRRLGEVHARVPEDIYSREFAEWLTEQYQLAMMKGIQLASQEDD